MNGRFMEFLNRYLPKQPGPMVTPEGKAGWRAYRLMYTRGSTKGLGIGGTG